MSLSPNQEKFCQLYVRTGNATQSYIDADYKCSEKAAIAASSRLLTNVKVRARIDELKKKLSEKMEITTEKLIKENAKIAFQDLNEVLEVNGGEVRLKEDFDMNHLAGLTISSSYSSGEKGDSASHSVSVKVSDKLKALQELARLKGAYADGSGDKGKDRQSNSRSILDSLARFTKKG